MPTDIQLVLSYGRELIRDRENVRGAPAIKIQMESISTRWEVVIQTTNSRKSLLENAFSVRFQEDIRQIIVWMDQKQNEIQKVNKKSEESLEFTKYIQVRCCPICSD